MQSVSQLDEVVDAVFSASRGLVGVAARSLAAVAEDVTLPQYRALVVLSSGSASMSDLAADLDVAPSTVTRLCDRLVRKKLVTRRHPPDDRRAVEVALTDAGRRLVQQVTLHRRREIARILEQVPERRRVELVRALRAFSDAAGVESDQQRISGWEL